MTGRMWNGAWNKKDGLKESGLLKAEFHLAVTYLREILPQSRSATRSVAINNVSARAAKLRVCDESARVYARKWRGAE